MMSCLGVRMNLFFLLKRFLVMVCVLLSESLMLSVIISGRWWMVFYRLL